MTAQQQARETIFNAPTESLLTRRRPADAAIDIEHLYTQFGPMVLRRCRKLLGSEVAAQDAMQDTFVNLLRHQHHLTCDSPSSLLYRMATNVCLNKTRSHSRRKETPESDMLQQIACANLPEDRFIAANILCKLFDKYQASTRTMAVMHLLDGMTLQEVADEVGMSVSGVRKRLRKVRAIRTPASQSGEE